jgi:hypothetical protein
MLKRFLASTAALAFMVGAAQATLQLSIGLSESMTTGVPEASTWAMLALGFGFMSLFGVRRARSARLAF